MRRMTSMDLFKNAWACHTAKASLQKSAIAFCQNCSDSENWKEIKQYTEGNKILGPVIFLLVSRSPKTYGPRRWTEKNRRAASVTGSTDGRTEYELLRMWTATSATPYEGDAEIMTDHCNKPCSQAGRAHTRTLLRPGAQYHSKLATT